LLPDTRVVNLSGLTIAAAALGFAIWARFTLGRNWSGTVTVKAGHELIRSGPYRFVRHPIYSGILAGLGFFHPAVPGIQWTRGAIGNADWTGRAFPTCWHWPVRTA
jgi:protein-S-isoprenylcysteine O-methyltransferase Ste14